jgi:RimJ/RimL family protein N-acetyltransferase
MTSEIHQVTSIEGRWVRMRPVSRADYGTLFQWRSDVEMVHLWNLTRRTSVFEQFIAEFEQTIKDSLFMVVIDRESERLIGYGQSYNASPWDRWLYLAAYVVEHYRNMPHFPEAAILSLDVLFRWYPLEKIYLEVYDFASWAQLLPQVGFVEEGYTPNHFWHDGRYWGLTRYALYRDRWSKSSEFLTRMLGERSARTVTASAPWQARQ